MKILLQYFDKEATLYVYERDFIDTPELFEQISVIKAISEDDISKAKLHWNILNIFNPSSYGENFQFKGPKGLFSITLQKALSKTSLNKNLVSIVGKTKEEKIIELLKRNQGPLSKETIYEFIYGAKPGLKSDYIKLSTLISTARKKFKVEIQTRKGCYLLITK